jgi:hypothetical protein
MIIPTASMPEIESVPEIQALTTRANELNGSVGWWNSAMIWALVFAAVAAIAVVLTTRVALLRAKQLGDVQESLIRAKDAQLAFDLRAKDEKISGLDLDSAKAKQDLAGIQKSAADAKAAQQRVETDLEKQREKTANAEKALLELQARLADRVLTKAQQDSLTNQLKQWAGIDVDVIVWGDSAEIEIISQQIMQALMAAGWHLHAGHAVGGGGAVRGILIGVKLDTSNNLQSASNALLSGLRSAGLASGFWKFDEMKQPGLMANTSYTGTAPIRLFIGSKAN